LKRFTLESHPDYQDIDQATSVMTKVVDDMNNTIKTVENINAILQIQKNFNDQVVTMVATKILTKDFA
jgi:capsular polysaccharide biosynthesis protein